MFLSSPEAARTRPDPPGLRVEVDRDRNVTIVWVTGDVDLATAGLLTAAADLSLLGPPLRVVVDLSQVTFFGATGLTVLLRLRQRARLAMVDLVLRAPSPAVRTVLDIVDATRCFRIDARCAADQAPATAASTAGTVGRYSAGIRPQPLN